MLTTTMTNTIPAIAMLASAQLGAASNRTSSSPVSASGSKPPPFICKSSFTHEVLGCQVRTERACGRLAPRGAAGGLGGADPGREPHRGDPDVDEQAGPGGRGFEDAPHGYDCRMTPHRNLERLKTEMEELFADLCHQRVAPQRVGFRPRVDAYRTADPPAVHVVVELAGVDPAEVELAVADGVLVVSGHRRRTAVKGGRYEHIELD